MTIINRLVFAALLMVLPLSGCSTPPQKASAQGDDRTSTAAGYLGQGEYTGSYWPTQIWRECKPEAVGMSSEKLLMAIEYAATPAFKTDGLAVIRKGHIVGEAYLGNFKVDSKHVSHSMAKSFTSCLVASPSIRGRSRVLMKKLANITTSGVGMKKMICAAGLPCAMP